jgi:hypothetical protein
VSRRRLSQVEDWEEEREGENALALRHHIKRNSLRHPQALLVETIGALGVVASGDGADYFRKRSVPIVREEVQKEERVRTASKQKWTPAARRRRRVNLIIQERAVPGAVLEEKREELDDFFDREDLFFEKGGGHALLDDDAAKGED